jgi:hypothetical protein
VRVPAVVGHGIEVGNWLSSPSEDVRAVLLPSGLAGVYVDGRLVGSWRRTWWRGRLVILDQRTPEWTRSAAELVLTTDVPTGWRRSLKEAIEAIEGASEWELFDMGSIPPIPRPVQVGVAVAGVLLTVLAAAVNFWGGRL